MIKENLYCVPYEKRVLRSSKGISYHCEREGTKGREEHNHLSKESSKSKSPKTEKSTKKCKCNVCGREFKDMRAMKIHKTKQNHHEEQPKSLKKQSSPSSNLKIMNEILKNNKRNREYSLSPFEIRANKAIIKEAK